MNILNPDLSHSEFLTESLSDINAANTLLDIGQFSQAAYMFQQSVEKSCKYFGLTIKILDYEDLRKTGHNPHAVFKKMFNSEEMQTFGGNNQFNTLENLFISQNIDERVECIVTHVNSALIDELIPLNNGKSATDLLIEHFEKNPFTKLMDISVVSEIRRTRHIPAVESLCSSTAEEINNFSICAFCQLIMSFLVWGIEANSRYPDYEKGTSPQQLYSETSVFIKNLPFFIPIQANCISQLNSYFRPIT